MTAIDKDALLAAMPLAGLFGVELLRAEAAGVEGTPHGHRNALLREGSCTVVH